MCSYDFITGFFITVVAGLLLGMGFLIYVGMKDEQAARLACINAGSAWIEKSCVKVAP